MRNMMLKVTGILASLAVMVASNTACMYWFHQPQAPEGLKKLR